MWSNQSGPVRAECARDRPLNTRGVARHGVWLVLARDSTNSSTPPSGDGVGPRKKRAERRAEARNTKRSQGKQPGSPGAYWPDAHPMWLSSTARCAVGGAERTWSTRR